jgi:Na+-driven multidrug efflux pump
MRVPSVTLFVLALAQVLLGGALGLGWGPLPQMGMHGVAAGGVLANLGGALFLWGYLISGRGRIQLNVLGTRVNRKNLFDILRVGAVACISPLLTVATILILTRLVSKFGTQALAGYGIGTRLEFLLVPIAFAIGVASVPIVGMAIGADNIARARMAAWTAAALMTVGLLAKTALFPFHLWLPPAHAGAPPAGSAVLSALVVKGSLFLLVRLWFDALPAMREPQAMQLLASLGAAAVVIGSVSALAQARLKLLVAYSTVAQIGYMVFVFTLVPKNANDAIAATAWTGAWLQVVRPVPALA